MSNLSNVLFFLKKKNLKNVEEFDTGNIQIHKKHHKYFIFYKENKSILLYKSIKQKLSYK